MKQGSKRATRILDSENHKNSNGASPEDSLEKSRKEIRNLTKSILDLANERQLAAIKVAKDKALLGEPIFNPSVESRLLSDSIEHAKEIGLNEQLAQTLVLDLMKYSKLAQSVEIYRRMVRDFLESSNIRVVSIVGSGRMGVWFAKYLQLCSAEVYLFDEKKERAKSKAKEIGVNYADSLRKVAESDLILVSVPISKTPKIIRDLSQLVEDLRKSSIIIEISSIKNEMAASGFYEPNALCEEIRFYSVHPLFGGSANPFEINSIIQIFPNDTNLLRGLFPHYALISLDWSSHDELMASFLTLPHALAIVFGDTLRSGGKLSQGVMSLNSPSFSTMLDLSHKVLNEDPDVYFEIQAFNPNSKRVLTSVVNSMLKLEKSINNRPEFVEFFLQIRKKIDSINNGQTH
jgi:chorismate mutase / prephenate dehydrogenase